MALLRLSISILFSTLMGRPTTVATKPGNWSKQPMAGALRPSFTHLGRPCSNRDRGLGIYTDGLLPKRPIVRLIHRWEAMSSQTLDSEDIPRAMSAKVTIQSL